MNFAKSYFLCLDIGTYGVSGLATRVVNGKMEKSYAYFVKNSDTVFALTKVVDELEQQLGAKFNSAYITGNLGPLDFKLDIQTKTWNHPHLITEHDMKQQINKITLQNGFYPLHIIPLYCKMPTKPVISISPVNKVDTEIKTCFSVLSYQIEKTENITEMLHKAHIKPIGFFDPSFLQAQIYRTNKDCVLFLDLGAEFTTVSIWVERGPLFVKKIPFGQNDITKSLATGLNISQQDADDLKISISSTIPNENDRFHPATETGKFASIQKSDINDIFQPKLAELINIVKQESATHIEKYNPCKIVLSGGGSAIKQINSYIEKQFNLPVENRGEMASINALLNYIWDSKKEERDAFIARKNKTEARLNKILRLFKRKKTKPKKRLIPILPSTLCFDMYDKSTYTMFASSGISMIHVDIMDGLYVGKIAGSTKELEEIRSNTNAHLHTHLMVQTPSIVVADIINAGADTIIIPAETPGTENAIKIIKKAGKRCGIALNPEIPASFISTMLPFIDEVMVMAVKPGASGQEFDTSVLQKIKSLDYTRKAHQLKYLISVDGGINPETAKLCWDAGANLLVSGSYLENAPDFRLAVMSLLKH